MRDVYLTEWQMEGDVARLHYSDDTVVCVRKEDFNRTFAGIITADKDAVVREFAIDGQAMSQTKPPLNQRINDAKDHQSSSSNGRDPKEHAKQNNDVSL